MHHVSPIISEDRRIREGGFAIWMALLAIVLFALIAAAIAMANRSSNTSTAEKAVNMQASTVISEAVNLGTGYDTLLTNGISINQITFDAAPNTGVFNPTAGGAAQQVPPPAALATPANNWVYKNNAGAAVVTLNGVGTTSPDYVISLSDLKQSACQQINKNLYNNTTVPVGAGTAADWNTAANAVDLSAVPALAGKAEMCIQTTDGKYAYFRVVSAQ